jgi:hypothetical protein
MISIRNGKRIMQISPRLMTTAHADLVARALVASLTASVFVFLAVIVLMQ